MKSYAEKLLKIMIELWITDNDHYIISGGEKLKLEINTRPKWLKGLELDFYIPDLKVAFEFQGKQHYNVILDSSWSNEKNFVGCVLRDAQKDMICRELGIVIFRLNAFDIAMVVNFLRAIRIKIASFYGVNYKYSGKISSEMAFSSVKMSEEHERLLKIIKYKSVLDNDVWVKRMNKHHFLENLTEKYSNLEFNSYKFFGLTGSDIKYVKQFKKIFENISLIAKNRDLGTSLNMKSFKYGYKPIEVFEYIRDRWY